MEDKIAILHSWKSEFWLLFYFLISGIFSLIISDKFPGSIIKGSLFSLGKTKILLSLPIFWLAPTYFISLAIFKMYNVKYFLDKEGIESREGILSFSKKTMRIRYEDIKSIELKQDIAGRILGFGTLSIGTPALGTVEIFMKNVPAADEIRDVIQNERDRRQKQLVKEFSGRKNEQEAKYA